eukprot:764079-Hanusia_phi.AAC.9
MIGSADGARPGRRPPVRRHWVRSSSSAAPEYGVWYVTLPGPGARSDVPPCDRPILAAPGPGPRRRCGFKPPGTANF